MAPARAVDHEAVLAARGAHIKIRAIAVRGAVERDQLAVAPFLDGGVLVAEDRDRAELDLHLDGRLDPLAGLGVRHLDPVITDHFVFTLD